MVHPLPTRILLVDDNDVGRYALSRMLRREGFDVIEAATGHAALRLAHAEGRDVPVHPDPARLVDRNGST